MGRAAAGGGDQGSESGEEAGNGLLGIWPSPQKQTELGRHLAPGQTREV